MEYTTNLNLKKPEATDQYDIGNENDNMDILDAAIAGKAPTSHADSTTAYGVGTASLYGHVKVDDALSSNSTNPVQNKVVKDALDTKQGTLTFDDSPTASSSNPVKSGGVYTALGNKQDTLTFDSAPTASSTNPVTSGGVYTALGNKQNKINSETQSGTLAISATSVTLNFSTETIGTDTLVDIYTDTYGVNPTAVTWTSSSMTLTFDAQQAAVKVKVKITN